MIFGRVFFATSLALASTVDFASAAATAKADCWFDTNCLVVLESNDGQCVLPPQGAYPLPEGSPPYLFMGEPAHFCGNRKSLLEDVDAARRQALTYCFDIGARSACIWGECDLPNSCIISPPEVWGDPHLRTWAGEVFDYHGVCDLMYLQSKTHNVTIHIRTTQRYQYSFVSSAVLELNGETFELGSWGAAILNGVLMSNANDFKETIGGYPIELEVHDAKTTTYVIQLKDGSAIEMKSFKDMVGVKLLGSVTAWSDSIGLMGNALTGQKLARDGKTVIEDINAFGQEWQVGADEKVLFAAVREPQAPAQCFLPTATAAGRRLGENMARAEAEEACKNWHMNKEACINDVMVSGDHELASNMY